MRILIAEDDPVSRKLLRVLLTRAGHDVVETEDGIRAWEAIRSDASLRLAVLDWMMPAMDGVDVCRRIRALAEARYVYVLLLTAKTQRDDIVFGLDAGADDYLTKPFNPPELLSRVRAGERIVRLESELARKLDELEQALAHVKQLQGLLPICMHCKKIRDDKDAWHQLESYIERNSEAMFTHSLCHECLELHYPDVADRRRRRRAQTDTRR